MTASSDIVSAMKMLTVLVPGLIVALALPALARADIPPSPDYVESCTVANHQGPGQECLICGDAYHGDVDACQRQHAPTGHTRRCRTAGASVWQEVWCKGGGASPPVKAPPVATDVKPAPQPATAPPAPAAADSSAAGSGCSVDPRGSLGGWMLALVGLAASRRRARGPAPRRAHADE